jgi:tetratricopeptide (TPR) repeat protein
MAGSHVEGLIETASELCSLHLCKEAIDLWKRASALNPHDSYIHYQLGLCYSHDCHEHGLKDPETAIYHYRQALTLTGNENSLTRAMLLADLGDTYLMAAPPSTVELLTSLECFAQAAEIYRVFGRLDDWAREQYELPNAWREIPARKLPWK